MNRQKLVLMMLGSFFLTLGACNSSERDAVFIHEKPDEIEESRHKEPTVVILQEKQDQEVKVKESKAGGETVALDQVPRPTEVKKNSLPMKREKMVALGVVPQALMSERMIAPVPPMQMPGLITESYTPLTENGFLLTTNDPLSTFSIDVDTASYANVRRFINQGQLPPVAAVRSEELINYFHYDYPQPKADNPFSVTTEIGPAPWNEDHKLMRIGLKARDIEKKNLPPSNLVFLIDVSGSMANPNKLGLLKKSMNLLVDQLGANDRVAIVVYAGQERVVLESTAGSEKVIIKQAINNLRSGGSTHGSKGIVTAYELAARGLMPRGNNRVILASDGDFNVGVTTRGELERLIVEKRKSGIYLTVLGLGMGNYHDDTMEILADKGNGNYAYIDNLLEAKKVLVKEMSGTLFALARDVKIQVEFNPAKVATYRLIGYENRALNDEDFNDDKKDAGEIGVGHTVTALYELSPVGESDLPKVDPLKYQKRDPVNKGGYSEELATVKLRYKPLQDDKSILLTEVVRDRDITLEKTSNDFRFAGAVAGFSMLLRKSEHVGSLNYESLLAMARGGRGVDREGYRAEFIRLLELAEMI